MSKEINWQPNNLENGVLKLQPLTPDDFEALYACASDPLIWEQHPVPDRYRREVFRHYFDSALESNGAFLILNKVSGKIIGCTRFYDYQPGNSAIVIGYTFFTREYWGGPYNRLSKELLIDYAFQFVENVYFYIGAGNIRSQRATAKLGAIRVKDVYSEGMSPQLLHFEYRIQKHEWIG